MKRPRVFVDGQEGTTGLRIHEYLTHRGDLEVLKVESEHRKDIAERSRLLNEADVAFLCLPDTAAREAIVLVKNPETRIIDASTAHRVDPAWVYGLPELSPNQRERIREAKRISNPGCHSTAFLLLVRPLVDAGILAPDTPMNATSLTGYSGGGKRMIEQYEAGADPRFQAPRPYSLTLVHKHLPEMMVQGGLAKTPAFLPIVCNFHTGLAVTILLHLDQLAMGTTGTVLHQVLEARYAEEKFVRVMPLSDPEVLEVGSLDIQACNGSNRADLFVFASATQALLIARIDNLGKGASGAAIQNMNLCLGMDEATGL